MRRMKTVAKVDVALQVVSAPEARCWLERDSKDYIYAEARDDAGGWWQLYALGNRRADLLRLRPGDRAGIRGNMAVFVKDGLPIVAVNVTACTVLPAARPKLRLVASNDVPRLTADDTAADPDKRTST